MTPTTREAVERLYTGLNLRMEFRGFSIQALRDKLGYTDCAKEWVRASDYDALAIDCAGHAAGEEAIAQERDALLAEVEGLRRLVAEKDLRVKDLARLINDHNHGLAQSCISQAIHGRCEPYTSRGRQCPDCPKDWAIDAALAPSEEA